MNKYDKIIKYIKNEILNCNIKSGEKLPSIRNISERFNCSKTTVVRAYDLMEKEHIVYSIPKSGYYLIERDLNLSDEVSNNKVDFASAAPDKAILPYEEFQHCTDVAMNLYKDNLFSNSNAQGLPNLIDAIMKQLQNYQVFAEKKNVFITSGSQQAINILTMMDFGNGGKKVLVEQPTYHGVLKSLRLNHVDIIGIKRNYDGIDFDELQNIFEKESIKFFYTIPRFHNPTGLSYSNDDKRKIIEICNKYNVYVVEDDYLGDLDIDKKSDPMYALDMNSRVIYLKSYSKVLLPGLRISAAVLPSRFTNDFIEYKRWNDLNTSVLSQGALEIYIKSGMFDENIKKFKEVYTGRMNYLNRLTRNLGSSKINWYIPKSGFFASCEINRTVNMSYIIKKLKLRNIIMLDTSQFYLNSNSSRLMRISLSRTNLHKIKKGILGIVDEIEKYT
ncbi:MULTISPECIES: PLP-dependent aminotransferase family protein [Clostridium]|uniref:aminotransferase-like domain-containing protein n=1 Tax=Clostridium TaxID=1485 RepID=UPI000827139A|nr:MULTISPECIES: PLP-dependent aminotransferase family protein [Clostridium]PJI09783.1 PLP-dependent aminotransferase family protein [Clostridium sp. CT7]